VPSFLFHDSSVSPSRRGIAFSAPGFMNPKLALILLTLSRQNLSSRYKPQLSFVFPHSERSLCQAVVASPLGEISIKFFPLGTGPIVFIVTDPFCEPLGLIFSSVATI